MNLLLLLGEHISASLASIKCKSDLLHLTLELYILGVRRDVGSLFLFVSVNPNFAGVLLSRNLLVELANFLEQAAALLFILFVLRAQFNFKRVDRSLTFGKLESLLFVLFAEEDHETVAFLVGSLQR